VSISYVLREVEDNPDTQVQVLRHVIAKKVLRDIKKLVSSYLKNHFRGFLTTLFSKRNTKMG
jgi:hypothetical protein